MSDLQIPLISARGTSNGNKRLKSASKQFEKWKEQSMNEECGFADTMAD